MNNWSNLVVLLVRPAITYLHIDLITKMTQCPQPHSVGTKILCERQGCR